MTSPNSVAAPGSGLSPGRDLVVMRDNNISDLGSREDNYTAYAVTLLRVLREKNQAVKQA